MRTPKLKTLTKLDRYVARWLRKKAKERDGDLQGVIRDLMHGGCSSGYVSELIFTSDCVEFYNKYREEIGRLYYDVCSDCGEPIKLNGWNDEDPFAIDYQNQIALAWFGFEETAYRICTAVGIEV